MIADLFWTLTIFAIVALVLAFAGEEVWLVIGTALVIFASVGGAILFIAGVGYVIG